MPPFVPRKREHSPAPSPPRAKHQKASKRTKPTLFEDADAPTPKRRSAEETKKFLDSLNDDGDDASSLSEVESDDFEDVPPAKKRRTAPIADDDSDEEGNEDEMDWEDAMGDGDGKIHPSAMTAETDLEISDVSIAFKDDGSYIEPDIEERMKNSGKKGPSKRDRQIRIRTHCLHVQSLLFHNTVRNSWLNDREVQKTLVEGVTEGVKREITRWREAMGMLSKEELDAKKKQAAAKNKGKKGRKSTEKGRDWSYEAQHTEQGVPNLSGGDPLLRLLKVLAAYWRKRFTITAPGLRKQGYMPLRRLQAEVRHWKENRDDAEEHGERIENLQAFQELAKACEGSRDVGGQLFVALLRGIGLEARMVASLQPVGFGWSKGEDAAPKQPKKQNAKIEQAEDGGKPVKTSVKKSKEKVENATPARKSTRGKSANPINLDDSDSSLSEPPSNDEHGAMLEDESEHDDDISVIDMTPATPKKKPTKRYDRDLAFPIYWTEVRSPISHKYIPVDPIVLSTIATNDELLQTFEPRGKKAEITKQVICYVTAFSSDGTAKDVTVRYIKKHQLPGKTKGMRMPVEKVPIHDRRGKVKKYEDYDWFRTVMSLYDRPDSKRTAADDMEEQGDLKPFKPATQGKEVEKESLQWYKQSADFALELHLRREEALLPGAQPVKTFTAGKGDKAKEYPVYRREDIATCRTVESWHKEGREVKAGEQPIKHVPMRAVTLVRKREMQDAERETGEKLKQGLYSRDQTDWIIPPPIENGVIPKNAYGNMDVYVKSMVPEGAIHMPLKGTAKICRKLGIDYAEACTGFEFGKQRAVPVLTGVVVAKENTKLVREAWRVEQAEIKRKEDTKRTATALHWWRKMLMGLRIVERMRAEYDHAGGAEEEINPFVNKARREGREAVEPDGDAGAGGFFPEGHDEEEASLPVSVDDADVGGGFLLSDEDDQKVEEGGDGGFLVEDKPDAANASKAGSHPSIMPVSLQSLHRKRNDHSDEDEDVGNEPLPKSAARRASTKKAATTAKPQTKPKGRPRAKVRDPSPESDDDDDDNSPSEALNDKIESEMSKDEEPDSASEVVTKSRKRPVSNGKATPRRISTRNTRKGKKATPTRSQYFAANDDDDDDDDKMSSEEEVIKPKRTTARTRQSG